MTDAERERFDGILEQVLDTLPPRLHELLEEAPLIVDDEPSAQQLEELQMYPSEADSLCGLYTGVPMTERSVEMQPELPETIHIFRRGIIAEANGWREPHGGDESVREQIRITVLHEIGHHFGLEEDDLEQLGYA